MIPDELDAILAASIADLHLSRSERQALAAAIEESACETDPADLRRRAFRAARAAFEQAGGPPRLDVLDWLEAVMKVIEGRGGGAASGISDVAEAYFSPGEECRARIARLLDGARKSADVCVFTITDDRIANPILEAHHRGVAVRVISDDDKSGDEGSDIGRFRSAGIAVRVDRTEFHMHHKFALFDGDLLLTGSYNWTRSAAQNNAENFVLTSEPRLLRPFAELFEELWRQFG